MTSERNRPLPDLNAEQLQRFYDKVTECDGCWDWQGTIDAAGYGRFPLGEMRLYAHRLMYKMSKGQDPGEKLVCHSCDNPKCVNPAHLFLGTDADNIDDKCEKGRDRRDDQSCLNSHLRTGDIIAIRQSNRPYAELALQFGTSESNICVIRTGRTHGHAGSVPSSRRTPGCIEDEQAVREMRLSNDSLRELGRRFNIDKATVKKIKQGDLGSFSWTDEERAACKDYLSSSTVLNANDIETIVASTDSVQILMERYGVSRSKIYTILSQHNATGGRDKAEKISGTMSPNSKITVDQVNEIRVSPDSCNALAARHGISKKAVLNIKHGKTYKDIPWPEQEKASDSRAV